VQSLFDLTGNSALPIKPMPGHYKNQLTCWQPQLTQAVISLDANKSPIKNCKKKKKDLEDEKATGNFEEL
jgi:hypothetical protein